MKKASSDGRFKRPRAAVRWPPSGTKQVSGAVEEPSSEEAVRGQNIALPIRAVIGNRSNGRPLMLAIQLDRLDDQVQGVHAVDFACHAIRTAWDGAKAFG